MTISNLAGAPCFVSESAAWGYDNARRLTSKGWIGAAAFSSTYGYDAGGNLTSLRGASLPVDPLSDQLSGYSYNSSGDMAGFTYDPAGRVKGLGGTSPYGTSESYTYAAGFDEDGLRQTLTLAANRQGLQNSTTETFVYDGDALAHRSWSYNPALPLSDLSSTDTNVFYLWEPTGRRWGSTSRPTPARSPTTRRATL